MKKLFLIIGIGVISNSLFSQTKDSTAFSFSVQQAIDYALKNQYNVQNAIIDQDLAAQKVKEVTGLVLPQINSSADFKDWFYLPTNLVPGSFFGGSPGSYAAARFGTQYQTIMGLDGSLLFNGDVFTAIQSSKVLAELSLKTLQRTKIETAVAVSKAYYTALINDARLKITDANIAQIKTAMDGANGMYQYGVAEKLDYDRLTVTYNNLLIEKEKIQRLVSLSRYLLKYQMGMDVNTNLELTDNLDNVKFDVATNTTAEKFDYTKRIEYVMFETQKKINQIDLKKSKYAFLPTATLYGNASGYGYSKGLGAISYGSNNNGDYFVNHTLYPAVFIGGKVTMPIFTGFQRNARNQQAKLSLQKAQNNIDNIKKSIDYEIASSMAMLQNAAVSLDNQKKNIALAEEVYRITKFKYDQGVGTNLEVVTAQSALTQAQVNYYNALFDAIVAKIDYDKANGNLKY